MKGWLNKIIPGDCLEVLKTLPTDSVDMCITSPPYWALRDYGVEGQLGLEPTFEEYINNLCAIFDEMRRVLKKEGTCWVNLGDTYGGSWGNYGARHANQRTRKSEIFERRGALPQKLKPPTVNMPEKCLLQIPSRFAIEMCNRGWILRNEIIWHKPNCMPASVKDRFTVDFEKLFFFTKSKTYYFNQQYEPYAEATIPRLLRGVSDNHKNVDGAPGQPPHSMNKPRVKFGGNKSAGYGRRQYSGNGWTPEMINPKGRNKRCVWTLSTKPFKESHFAVYPPDLIETPVKAGCPMNGIVLDPFMGSGTTAVVAKKLGRNYVGIELNRQYVGIANRRVGLVESTLPFAP